MCCVVKEAKHDGFSKFQWRQSNVSDAIWKVPKWPAGHVFLATVPGTQTAALTDRLSPPEQAQGRIRSVFLNTRAQPH